MRSYTYGLLLILAACAAGCDTADSTDDPDPGAQCPAGPNSRQADFFPLEVGRSWTYRFREYSSGAYDRRGTFSLTVTSAICRDGSRTVSLYERRTVDGDPASYEYTRTYTEDASNVLHVSPLPGETEGVQIGRYALAGAGTIRSSTRCTSPGLVIREGEGIESWDLGCVGPASSSWGGSLLRLSNP